MPGADGDVILYDATSGVLERVGAGQVVSSLPLGRSDVLVARPDGSVAAHSVTTVNDIAVDDHGVTWYIDGGTNELVRVRM